jgi:Tol biopolymer transport system component
LWSLNPQEPSAVPKAVFEDNVYRASFPAFSPDGSRIAFFSRLFGGRGDIWIANADGSNASQLTSSAAQEVLPEWSHDGKAVIYGHPVDGGVELWERSLTGSDARALTAGRRKVPGWPRLSPDRRRVVYHTYSHSQPNEAVLNIITASLPNLDDVRQLTHDAEGAGFPAWSRDGKWIGYELIRGSNVYLAVMQADGTGQRQITTDEGKAWLYDWSPDSTKILFAGFRDGVWNLWTLDWRTREQRRLTNYRSLRTFVRYPVWSPRGDQIVYEIGTTRGNVFRLELSQP